MDVTNEVLVEFRAHLDKIYHNRLTDEQPAGLNLFGPPRNDVTAQKQVEVEANAAGENSGASQEALALMIKQAMHETIADAGSKETGATIISDASGTYLNLPNPYS